MSNQFAYLFSPINLGPLEVRNRIVITAHLKNFTENCRPSERDLYYYAERARGGVGLIITEATAVHPNSLGERNYPIAYDPAVIPAYAKVAAAVHTYGALIVAQLHHSGHLTDGSPDNWGVALAPSPIASTLCRSTPREMSPDEIAEIVQGFEVSARNMQQAGMDGVEIHAASGYLLHQFLSPCTNKRDDEYGGDLENRLRLTLEVVDRVRRACGPQFAVGVRLVGDEFVPGGFGLSDAQKVAARLEATGQIDYISVTGGTTPTAYMVIGGMHLPQGYLTHLAAGVKEAVEDVPVIAVGRIVDPLHAERILAEGQADLVGMTRANICDPELANKAREGRLDDIRTCVGCNQGCRARYQQKRPITCIQNPTAGREKELGFGTLVPAEVRRTVVVVGGGPGGMEAARVLATRGHRVTLLEERNELGGQVNLAVKAPGREEFGGVARYLRQQIEKLGVTIRLGTKADIEVIRQLNPDAVVVATGSRPSLNVHSPYRPNIPGAEAGHVLSVWEVFDEGKEVGQSVVVVDEDGHQRGASVVDYLSSRGKSVHVVTPLAMFGYDLVITHDQPLLYQRVGARDVTLRPFTIVREIRDHSVVAYETYSKRETVIQDVDTVVLVVDNEADDALYRQLKETGTEVYAIGDCVAPRGVAHAIFEANRVGRAI